MASLKTRLILSGILGIVVFIVIFIEFKRFDIGLIVGALVFLGFMYLTSPKRIREERERRSRERERQEDIRELNRDEYAREKARQRAREDYRRERAEEVRETKRVERARRNFDSNAWGGSSNVGRSLKKSFKDMGFRV